MTLRLEADGLAPFTLDDANGIRVAMLDLGFPDVRAVAADRVDQNGVDDDTAHHGASLVTIQATVIRSDAHDVQEVVDRLGAFLNPRYRPYLYFDQDGISERRVRLRVDQLTRPIVAPHYRRVQVSWRAPDGIAEAVTATVVDADATTEDEGGRTYPLAHPRSYSTSSPVGAFDLVNAGTVDVYPLLELWGPCTGPRIENRDGDGYLSLPTLTLAASEWLEVDTRERTIRLNGLANQSRYDLVDFDTFVWPSAAPGTTSWRYFPSSFGAGCHVVATLRSGWQ